MNKYLQQVQEYFRKEGICTTYEESGQRFDTICSGNYVEVHSRLCYEEKSKKLEHIVFLGAKTPAEREKEICVLLNLMNDCIGVGHFMLTKQRYVVCMARFYTNGDAAMTDGQMERLLRTPLDMAFNFEKTIMQVAFGDIDAHDAMERFWEEREAERQAEIKENKPSIKETIKKWIKGICKN